MKKIKKTFKNSLLEITKNFIVLIFTMACNRMTKIPRYKNKTQSINSKTNESPQYIYSTWSRHSPIKYYDLSKFSDIDHFHSLLYETLQGCTTSHQKAMKMINAGKVSPNTPYRVMSPLSLICYSALDEYPGAVQLLQEYLKHHDSEIELVKELIQQDNSPDGCTPITWLADRPRSSLTKNDVSLKCFKVIFNKLGNDKKFINNVLNESRNAKGINAIMYITHYKDPLYLSHFAGYNINTQQKTNIGRSIFDIINDSKNINHMLSMSSALLQYFPGY